MWKIKILVPRMWKNANDNIQDLELTCDDFAFLPREGESIFIKSAQSYAKIRLIEYEIENKIIVIYC